MLAGIVPVAATTGVRGPHLAAQAQLPFSLGPDPIPARGTFRNGSGGCAVVTAFTDTLLFYAPGDGTLTITQPRTRDFVAGSIDPDETFQLLTGDHLPPHERYIGRIIAKTATATYRYTDADSCTETYDAEFILDRPESDLELTLSAPARVTIKRVQARQFARVIYRVGVVNHGPATSGRAIVNIGVSRSVFVYGYARGGANAPQPIQACSPRSRRSTATFVCQIPALGVGASGTLTIFTEARRPGSYVARGTVVGQNIDPIAANTLATSQTTVRR